MWQRALAACSLFDLHLDTRQKIIFASFPAVWGTHGAGSGPPTLVPEVAITGRVGGRPSKMTPEKVKVARDMYASREYTVEAIAETIGVSRKTIYRHLAAG